MADSLSGYPIEVDDPTDINDPTAPFLYRQIDEDDTFTVSIGGGCSYRSDGTVYLSTVADRAAALAAANLITDTNYIP